MQLCESVSSTTCKLAPRFTQQKVGEWDVDSPLADDAEYGRTASSYSSTSMWLGFYEGLNEHKHSICPWIIWCLVIKLEWALWLKSISKKRLAKPASEGHYIVCATCFISGQWRRWTSKLNYMSWSGSSFSCRFEYDSNRYFDHKEV